MRAGGEIGKISPDKNFYVYDMCLCVCVHKYSACSTIHLCVEYY